jgi:predicted nucleic acid-binding protein
MTQFFADTSYLVALFSPRDQHHAAALKIVKSVSPSVVITEFVLLEFANALSHVGARTRAMELWRHLRGNESTEIVPASHRLLQRGFDLYCSRPDKEWSLTDCISFVVMEDRGLSDALTADRHFQQAGFNALLVE